MRRLQVFAQLATVHSGCMGNGVQLCYTDRPTGTDCFSTIACTPHAGLRQYPFLGQVRHSRWLCASGTTSNPKMHTTLLLRTEPRARLCLQVCKRWRHLLSEPNSQAQLWQSVRPGLRL